MCDVWFDIHYYLDSTVGTHDCMVGGVQYCGITELLRTFNSVPQVEHDDMCDVWFDIHYHVDYESHLAYLDCANERFDPFYYSAFTSFLRNFSTVAGDDNL